METMNKLIEIKQSEGGENVVSARDLYRGLVNDDNISNFTKWASANIKNNQFAFEFTDYQTIRTLYDNGREGVDYAVTIDFAKKLCMLSRCENGEKIRDYFIACENKLKEITQYKVPQNFIEALQLAIDQQKYIEEQQKQLEEAKPKVEFFDAVANSKTAVSIEEVSKVLAIKGLGRNNLFQLLRDNKVLRDNNLPYQEFVDRGYFRCIEQKYVTAKGETHISFKTLVYQRGIEFIRRLIEKNKSKNLLLSK